jgi:ketosteroid isomerase-like protein
VPGPCAGMPNNTEIARLLIGQLRDGRAAEDLSALLSEQVVMELPFAPSGVPKSVSGKTAVLDALGYIAEEFERFRINVHESYETTDGAIVILECTAFGLYRRSAAAYQNRYVFVFRFQHGVVVHWREFFNPYPVIQSMPSTSH